MDTYLPILIPADQPEKLAQELERLHIQEKRDAFRDQAEELYEVTYPSPVARAEVSLKQFFETTFGNNLATAGTWVLYPWLYTAVHILDQAAFFKVRTARNHNIITSKEQHRFAQGRVAIAGLSVGSGIAYTLAMIGGAQTLFLADFDTLSLSNTNRVAQGVAGIGVNKAVLCARRLVELNPYLTIYLFPKGVTEENMTEFLGGEEPVSLLFEEIDNLLIKVRLRRFCQKAQIPVVMVTDNGDNAMIDIERYDQGVTSFFHGRLTEEEAESLFSQSAVDPRTRVGLTLKIIGAENGVPRMQESLLEVGKSLVSWPQMGTATTLTGAIGAYIARRLILKEPLQDGRSHLSLDGLLIPDYTSEEAQQKRAHQTQQFVQHLEQM